jgi:hypothetical protein
VVGGLAGCSDPSDSTPFPGACGPLQPVAWTPQPSSLGVPTDTVISIVFDDYPDPDTVRSSTLLLGTGPFWIPGAYSVDLLAKAAVLRPWRPLVSDLGYTVRIFPALHALSGCPVAAASRTFRTGDGPAGGAAPPVPAFAQIATLFGSRCAGSGCHLDSGGDCLPAPAMALPLCAAAAWDALVDVPSAQLSGVRRVEPGNSARSYLLRKLLPPSPGSLHPPGAMGHRDPPDAPLSDDQIRAVAAWIDSGAPR